MQRFYVSKWATVPVQVAFSKWATVIHCSPLTASYIEVCVIFMSRYLLLTRFFVVEISVFDHLVVGLIYSPPTV